MAAGKFAEFRVQSAVNALTEANPMNARSYFKHLCRLSPLTFRVEKNNSTHSHSHSHSGSQLYLEILKYEQMSILALFHVRLSIRLLVRPAVRLSACRAVCISVRQFVPPVVCLSVHPCIRINEVVFDIIEARDWVFGKNTGGVECKAIDNETIDY